MANIFLTVVGTNDYKPTDYRLGDNVCSQERYVQKALLKMLSESGEKFDRIIFFLTSKAKEKNWEEFRASRADSQGNYETDEGLRPFLEKNFPGIYEAVSISDGTNETEQLELFNKMYDAIREGDEITFDVTHGFRSIPFLFFPVMSYAKELKKITIKRIYYGCFSSESVVSNIIDLKKYDEILDCANAAHNFICSGNSSEIVDVINQRYNTLSIDAKRDFSNYCKMSNVLKDVSTALLTCQGGEQKNAIKHKTDILLTINKRLASEHDDENKIFNNIFSHAIESVKDFNSNNKPYVLGINAVKWYMERDLIMQAYTALKETISTFFCHIYAPDHNYIDHNFREKVIDRAISTITPRNDKKLTIESCSSQAIKLLDSHELNEKERKEYAAVFYKIILHTDFEKTKYIRTIAQIRNNMDHFGMNNNALKISKSTIEDHLNLTIALFKDIEERINDIIPDADALAALNKLRTSKNGVFINFSNHSVENWSDDQITAAKELCCGNEIIDIAFPSVSADASEEDIFKLAEECAKNIISRSPAAVMCMGEFGICHRVVEILKDNNITTVYSCSERSVTETVTSEGTEKISVFKFVKFRKY